MVFSIVKCLKNAIGILIQRKIDNNARKSDAWVEYSACNTTLFYLNCYIMTAISSKIILIIMPFRGLKYITEQLHNWVQHLVCKHSSCSVYYAMSNHAYRKLANCFGVNVYSCDVDFRYKVVKGFIHERSIMFVNYIRDQVKNFI